MLPLPEEIRRLLLEAAGPLRLVTAGGTIPLLLEDLDRDGQPEIITVAAAVSDPEMTTRSLSDYKELFSADRAPVPFYLVVFSYSDQGLQKIATVRLGAQMVYRDMRTLPLVAGRSLPFAVVTTFHTKEGQEQRWVLFTGQSVRPTSTLSLVETLASRLRAEDIDYDGILDVIVEEQGPEEGVGYETFLTLYRWNGARYVESSTVNVVRNLREFLEETRRFLLAGQWADLISYSFAPDQVRALRQRGWTDADMVFSGVGLSVHYDRTIVSPPEALAGIRDVILPRFLENPFTIRDRRGSYFRMACRAVDSAGVSRVLEAPLYLMRNPFGEKQFFFLIQ